MSAWRDWTQHAARAARRLGGARAATPVAVLSLGLGIGANSSFFKIFGARTTLGRVFGPDDDAPGRSPLAILTHAFWMRRFAGDSAIIGKCSSMATTSRWRASWRPRS